MTKSLSILLALGVALTCGAQQKQDAPTTVWKIAASDDTMAYDQGILHVSTSQNGDTASHANATLELPIPRTAKAFEIAFYLKFGDPGSVPLVFQARAGDKKPLYISYSAADNREHILLADNEINQEVADRDWHSFKLRESAGRIKLFRDEMQLADLPNTVIPDLLEFGSESGPKGKLSEAWLRLVSANYTPSAPGEEAKPLVPPKIEAEPAPDPKDMTLLANAQVSLEVVDLANPIVKDPLVEASPAAQFWYAHVMLRNQGATPVNFFDFGPAWIRFDNYQAARAVPYVWDAARTNANTGAKGVFRVAKRSECWLQPGQAAQVFYCSGGEQIAGKPLRIEFVSGGTFKFQIPPP